MNGRNLDVTSVATFYENSDKLMLGYDKNNIKEWKKDDIKMLKPFAQDIVTILK